MTNGVGALGRGRSQHRAGLEGSRGLGLSEATCLAGISVSPDLAVQADSGMAQAQGWLSAKPSPLRAQEVLPGVGCRRDRLPIVPGADSPLLAAGKGAQGV